jgi:hypothetical protein
MFPRALRHEHDQQNHDGCQRGRRGVSAERQTAMVERLVEEVANGSPKRPRSRLRQRARRQTPERRRHSQAEPQVEGLIDGLGDGLAEGAVVLGLQK